MGNKEEDYARLAREQAAGQQALARLALAREFDPNYVPAFDEYAGPRVSPEERRRRDDYRKHLGQWKKLYEG
jgi:hypothetical protein